MNLFGRFTHSHEEEETIPIQAPVPTGNTIIFLYHTADTELWYDLAPHINVLVLRQPNIFNWKYYTFNTTAKPEEEQHERFITDLQKTLLFIPCTSPVFLSTFMQKCKQDKRCAEALPNMYVQPIPFKGTHGVSQTILEHSLDAYEKGYKRDAACITVIQTIEQKLLYHIGQTQKQLLYSPPITLNETSKSQLVLAERAQTLS